MEMKQSAARQAYHRPSVRVLGTIEQLTQAGGPTPDIIDGTGYTS